MLYDILKSQREAFIYCLGKYSNGDGQTEQHIESFIKHCYARLTESDNYFPLKWKGRIIMLKKEHTLELRYVEDAWFQSDKKIIDITLAELFPDEYEDWEVNNSKDYNVIGD